MERWLSCYLELSSADKAVNEELNPLFIVTVTLFLSSNVPASSSSSGGKYKLWPCSVSNISFLNEPENKYICQYISYFSPGWFFFFFLPFNACRVCLALDHGSVICLAQIIFCVWCTQLMVLYIDQPEWNKYKMWAQSDMFQI